MTSNSILVSSFVLLCGAALALAETCPKDKDMGICTCYESMGSKREISIECYYADNPELEKLEVIETLFAKLQGKKIADLTLYDIPFKRIPSDFFKGLRVRRLSLQNCELEGLATTDEDLPFQGLEDSLEELQIDECFEGANELKHLNLRHLNRLEKVFFVDNNVPEIKNEWFQDGPSRLEDITFNRCQVKKIGDQAFASLPYLEHLTLNENAIEKLDRSMFSKVSKLESLLLENNRVSSLPEDIFSGMLALNHIDFEGNDFHQLPEATWSPVWSQLEQLYLQNNRLECDSHMDWMFALDRPPSLGGTCVSPRDRKGIHLEDLIDELRTEE